MVRKGEGCFFSTKREKVRKRGEKNLVSILGETRNGHDEWSLKVTELVLIKNLIKIVPLKRFSWNVALWNVRMHVKVASRLVQKSHVTF